MSPDAATVPVTCRDVDLEGYHVQLREIVSDGGLPSRTTTLVVLFGFVNQSAKVINRFCNIYHALGFNVLFVPGYASYLTWLRNAPKLSQLVLHYLDTSMSSYQNLLFHSISAGCYIVCVIVELMRSEETKYVGIVRRICGAIYDSISVGTISHLSLGLGMAISDNRLIQRATAISILSYYKMLAVLDIQGFTMFRRSRRNLRLRPLAVPTLMFHCWNDPMCSNEMLNEMVRKWQETLSYAFVKIIWQDSKHSEHLRVHTDEYMQTLYKFVKDLPELATGITTMSKL